MLGLEVEDSIVQANIIGHTGASGWARIARPAIFEGTVEAGRDHILVDDFVGQGGTLANLRGCIMRYGGLVGGAVTLTGRADLAETRSADADPGSARRETWKTNLRLVAPQLRLRIRKPHPKRGPISSSSRGC